MHHFSVGSLPSPVHRLNQLFTKVVISSTERPSPAEYQSFQGDFGEYSWYLHNYLHDSNLIGVCVLRLFTVLHYTKCEESTQK